MPAINWGRHLVGNPMPGRVDTKGCICYQDPNMARPLPSATPSDTKAWEREIWVDRMASLSNLRDHVPGDLPTPDNQQPAPPTYMTLMYNKDYTLPTTHYHAATGHYAPPPRTRRAPTRTPGRTSLTTQTFWGTWERTSLDTLLPIHSCNQDLVKAIFCLANPTLRSWKISTDRWLWKRTLCPKQREAP